MTTRVTLSGNNDIDGLLYGGYRWDSLSITYSFYQSVANPQAYENFEALNSTQVEAVLIAFREISSFTPITFTEDVNNTGMLTFGCATKIDTDGDGEADRDIPTASGGPPTPNNSSAGDIWFNPYGYDNPLIGSYQFASGIIHEIGHALGLKHPHEIKLDAPLLAANRDGLAYTVMSYRDYPGDAIDSIEDNNNLPQSYMMLDIAALQYLYGANFNSNSGATTYKWFPTLGTLFGRTNFFVNGLPHEPNLDMAENVVFRTIWDGGGIDTYDFSLYTTTLNVDLRPGEWTSLGTQLAALEDDQTAPGNIANALLYKGDLRSLIENAIGGSGNDVMRGNQANNTLTGNDGNDQLFGGNGNDTLDSGKGGGALDGGAGSDTLIAGSGAETVDGGGDQDFVDYARSTSAVSVDLSTGKATGGFGNGDTLIAIEHVTGSAFSDSLAGDDNFNSLVGGFGDDTLQGRGGADVLFGGFGFDTAVFGGSSVTVNLVTGVHGGEAAGDIFFDIERFIGTPGDDRMVGDDSSQTLIGGAGADELLGNGGADILLPGDGLDKVNGGNGIDRVSYSDAAAAINANLAVGKATGGDGVIDTLISIEILEGSRQSDFLTGSNLNDELYGMGGNDQLDGGVGDDVMAGGLGNDVYFVNTGKDSTVENAQQGTDTVYASISWLLRDNFENLTLLGSAVVGYGNERANIIRGNDRDNILDGEGGEDRVIGGIGNDTLSGGGGFDFVDYSDAGLGVTVDLGPTTAQNTVGAGLDTLSGFEGVIGSRFDDVLLRGFAPTVILLGGGGNDLFHDHNFGNDTFDGGQGTNTIDYSTGGSESVIVDLAAGRATSVGGSVNTLLNIVNATGSGGGDRLLGNGNANVLRGLGGNDTLNGRAGIDEMRGNAGNDIYVVDNAADEVFESANQGTDTVRSSVSFSLVGQSIERLELTGSFNTDGTGNGVANQVIGNAGNNTLNGATGNDILTGGGGIDFFKFNTALNASTNVDNITDFQINIDKIALENAILTAIGPSLTADEFVANANGAAATSLQHILYDTTDGGLYYDADGNGAQAKVHFATLKAGLGLDNLDFLVT